VHKKVEKMNHYLFVYTYKSNKIKFGMQNMRLNNSEIKQRSLVNTGDISPEIAQIENTVTTEMPSSYTYTRLIAS